MKNMKKLILPFSIILGCIILGSFYYLGINKVSNNNVKYQKEEGEENISKNNLVPGSEDAESSFQKFDAAMKCAYLAEFMNNPEETERLFLYGYQHGEDALKTEMPKLLSDKSSSDIKNKDLTDVIYSLGNSGHHFILGHLFTNISNEIFSEINVNNDPDLWEGAARKKFNDINCSLIGL